MIIKQNVSDLQINFPNNEDIMKKFTTWLKLQKKKENTIVNKIWILKSFFNSVHDKEAKILQKHDS